MSSLNIKQIGISDILRKLNNISYSIKRDGNVNDTSYCKFTLKESGAF